MFLSTTYIQSRLHLLPTASSPASHRRPSLLALYYPSWLSFPSPYLLLWLLVSSVSLNFVLHSGNFFSTSSVHLHLCIATALRFAACFSALLSIFRLCLSELIFFPLFIFIFGLFIDHGSRWLVGNCKRNQFDLAWEQTCTYLPGCWVTTRKNMKPFQLTSSWKMWMVLLDYTLEQLMGKILGRSWHKHNSRERALYLRITIELHLKRIMVKAVMGSCSQGQITLKVCTNEDFSSMMRCSKKLNAFGKLQM